ncbi:MAG: ATP-binding protein, partial [Actinobacteria bacterium]|nr:ATP-binding protein [Actinomycetota bacterium]
MGYNYSGYRPLKKKILPSRNSIMFKKFLISDPNNPMNKKAGDNDFLLKKAIMSRIKLEKDFFALVSGATGSGKSLIVAHIGYNIFSKVKNPIKKDGSMMFEDSFGFIAEEKEMAIKMIQAEGQMLWYDEARDGVNRQTWAKGINQSIKARKNTNRKLSNVYFFCMPFEIEFDPRLSAHLKMWFYMIDRNIAQVFCAPIGSKGDSGLNPQKIVEREQKWFKENPTRTKCPPTIHPEFVGYYVVPNLPKEQIERYKK